MNCVDRLVCIRRYFVVVGNNKTMNGSAFTEMETTSPLKTVVESLNKTPKGQLPYDRDPLSARSTLDCKPYSFRENVTLYQLSEVDTYERHNMELPLGKKGGSINDSSDLESQFPSPDNPDPEQLKWQDIALMQSSLNFEDATPVYNMSYEMMLKLFEAKEEPTLVSIIHDSF